MSLLVSVKAYDGSIVRIPKDKIQSFNLQQSKIKKLLDEGVPLKDIESLIKDNKL